MSGRRPVSTIVRSLVVGLGLAGVLAGCGSPSGPGLADAEPELSDALAYRVADPRIEIVTPADGDTVASPFVVSVVTDELSLGEAGRTRDGEGHWHLLIDQGCREPGAVIGDEAGSFHVGAGRHDLELDLPPGRHELCAQVGDGFHVAVAVSHTIVVDVQP